jgi:HTH-type transcriptional regulator/antitoxin HipB
MNQFPVHAPEQLSVLLQAFRKEAGFTQREVALRLGVTQQTYSAMERNADKVGATRLLKLLSILGVQMTLGMPGPTAAPTDEDSSDEPSW